jgi:hypothetical protein
MVMPSEWMPVVFSDPDEVGWESPEQAQRAMSLLMRLHNEIASELSADGRRYSIIIDRLGDGADALELADDWCRGYALGMALREDEWKEERGAGSSRASGSISPDSGDRSHREAGPGSYRESSDVSSHGRCATAVRGRDRPVVALEALGVAARHCSTAAFGNHSPRCAQGVAQCVLSMRQRKEV